MSSTPPAGSEGAAGPAGPATPGEDFDPLSVPIRPAATVMVLEDRPTAAGSAALQVLMLRRTARAVFAGDMWVYPGGRVDPTDEAIAAAHVVGLSAAEADHRLGVTAGGLAYWVAALRECFEEAGILLARRRADGSPIDAADRGVVAELSQLRTALNQGELTFADVIEHCDVELDAARIHYVAHWVTPLGSPRRFDTRFFVAAAPPGQIAAHDDTEVVHHEWVSPGPAIAEWQADRMAMMTPTARMLMCLAPFQSAAEAVEAAGLDVAPEQIRVLRRGDEYRIMLPGDDGWDDGDPDAEFGWVKLRRP